jgi:hypothetical protein
MHRLCKPSVFEKYNNNHFVILLCHWIVNSELRQNHRIRVMRIKLGVVMQRPILLKPNPERWTNRTLIFVKNRYSGFRPVTVTCVTICAWTYSDLFRRVGMTPRAWLVCFPNSPAIAQIAVSSPSCVIHEIRLKPFVLREEKLSFIRLTWYVLPKINVFLNINLHVHCVFCIFY